MSQRNVDIAREFIEAYNRRDFDAAVESFDPEVDPTGATLAAALDLVDALAA